MVCMEGLLSSNAHISSHFVNIHLKLLTPTYSKVFFHSIWSEYKNFLNRFYDVITNVVYWVIISIVLVSDSRSVITRLWRFCKVVSTLQNQARLGLGSAQV